MKKTFIVLFMVFGLIHAVSAMSTKLIPDDGSAGDKFGDSVSISGDLVVIGSPSDDDNGADSGAVYLYNRNGGQWEFDRKLVASDGMAGDKFGDSLDADDVHIVVGAWSADSGEIENVGVAYVYHWNGTNWIEEARLMADDMAEGDRFGYAVAISGDRIIIGADSNDDNGTDSGSAYFFQKVEGTWTQLLKVTANDAATSDRFGVSVAIDGDNAVIGADRNDDAGVDSGSAYLYHFDGASWSLVLKLLPNDGASGDRFGCSVSINAFYALIGANGDDNAGNNSGSAYLFFYNGLSWIQSQKLTAPDGAVNDWFGRAVAISESYAIVGANFVDNDPIADAGAAYLYSFSGTSWLAGRKILPFDGNESGFFGNAVDIDGSNACIGAWGDNQVAPGAGAAYIYSEDEFLVPLPAMDLIGMGLLLAGLSVPMLIASRRKNKRH